LWWALAPALALALGLAAPAAAPLLPGAAAHVGFAARVGLAAQTPTRYVRYEHGGRVAYGVLEGGTIQEISDAPWLEHRRTGAAVPEGEVTLLAPVDPERTSKVIGVAVNTKRPSRMDPIPHPRWFAKFPTALNRHEGDVELPPEASNLNYEGELVLVIGREGRHIPEARALEHVFGVTVGNDFSENTWYGENNGVDDPTRMISKGTDTWAPIGPALVTGVDYTDLAVETRLNGEVVQRGRTSDLVNGVANLVSHVSRYVTLKPGDVIFTGTVLFEEGARRAMRAGDVLEVEIEGLGVLRNRIVAMDERPRSER
jgi:2-keto-4-pentenoate hydratase/2-oxohepta-3-ene-1,7-dioic acid hydratase in catechol pathway